MGYFVYESFEMLVKPKWKDFSEMFLHHIATLSLLYFSYMSNIGSIGYMILWIHYIADINLTGAWAFGDFDDHWFAYLNFGLLLFSWPYSRLYAYADMIYSVYNADFRSMNCGLWNPEFS